jgi:hypothetical protein
MNGRFPENNNPADEECKHCEKWFHTRGIVAHQRNCSYQDVPYTAVGSSGDSEPSDDGGSPSEESPSEGATPPTDGVGDGAPPEGSTPNDDPARTDGAGLGLEGPPETTTDDNGGENMNCCDNPDLEEIPEGTDVDLDNGVTITTEAGDKFCTNCQAVVEADGGRIVR